ncbi:MAG: hypothetical protein RL885_21040 [Planctomycetota bacterium]
MSNRTERPIAWPTRLLSWLVGDPWRKIVAILLAIFLYNQIDREISGEQEIQLHLTGLFGITDDEVNLNTLRLMVPKEYMIVEFVNRSRPLQPELVQVSLSGPSKSLPRAGGIPYLNLTYQIDLSDVDPAPEFYESLDLAEIVSRKISSSDLTIQCDPPTMRVRIARVEERSLKLRPEFLGEPSAQPPEGYRWIRDQVTFDPGTISIKGPKVFVSDLEAKINEEGTFFQSFSLSDATFTDSRVLTVADWLDKYGITTDPDRATATLPIEDEMDPISFQLSVKDLVVRNEPQDAKIILEAANKSVTLQVPRVLTERFDLDADSPVDVLRPFLEYFILFVDAKVFSEGVENTSLVVRIQALDDEISTDDSLEKLLPAFRRVRLAQAVLWGAERKASE